MGNYLAGSTTTTDWSCYGQKNIVAEHRVPPRTYVSWLTNDPVLFDNYQPCNGLSHITTLEKAFKIIREGQISLSLISNFSVVSKHAEEHPLRDVPVIWLSPTFSQQTLTREGINRYGNVKFSVRIDDWKNYHFYLIEYMDYVKERAVRVLISQREYPEMREFYPFNGTNINPICIIEGILYKPTEYSVSSGKWPVTVEVIFDWAPSEDMFSVSYVPCNSPKAHIEGKVTTGQIPAFDEENLLGYLFYIHLVYEKRRLMRAYGDELDKGLMGKLERAIRELRVRKDDFYFEQPVESSLDLDILLHTMRFSDSFRKSAIDGQDVKRMCKIYCQYRKGKLPSLTTCLEVIHARVAWSMKHVKNWRDGRFQLIMETFLQHFCFAEAEILRKQLIEFVQVVSEGY